MNTKRIEEIQKETAYPDSISVQQALLKVWNECEQGKQVAELYQPLNGHYPVIYLHEDDIKQLGFDIRELHPRDLRSLAIRIGDLISFDFTETLREVCRDELKLKNW